MYWSINEKHAGRSLGIGAQNAIRKPVSASQLNQNCDWNTPAIYVHRPSDCRPGDGTPSRNRSSAGRIGPPQQQINTSLLSPRRMAGFSKSEQAIDHLLLDQLELAYVDHARNLRDAQSYTVFQQLRRSQPKLELSPNSSRHSSPVRPRAQTGLSRSNSPLASKFSDGGLSSGSENSRVSNRSLSHSRGTQHNSRELIDQWPPASPRFGSHTAPCSPQHQRARNHCTHTCASVLNHELLKHAHINLIWRFIQDAVKSARLENFDFKDPKLWWRRLFSVLRQRNGKGG